jgi:DNA-binding transcriptional regulator YdaS (Cro superfamily)
MTDPTVIRAIEKMGSAAKLAAALGITRSAVSQWHTIPQWHIARVSEVTGIPIQELVSTNRKRATAAA